MNQYSHRLVSYLHYTHGSLKQVSLHVETFFFFKNSSISCVCVCTSLSVCVQGWSVTVDQARRHGGYASYQPTGEQVELQCSATEHAPHSGRGHCQHRYCYCMYSPLSLFEISDAFNVAVWPQGGGCGPGNKHNFPLHFTLS